MAALPLLYIYTLFLLMHLQLSPGLCRILLTLFIYNLFDLFAILKRCSYAGLQPMGCMGQHPWPCLRRNLLGLCSSVLGAEEVAR